MNLRAFCPLLFCLLLIPPLWADQCQPPPVMLPEVHHAGDPIDVSQWWISEKLDGVRGRWDGEKLCTRGGHRIHAPAWFTAGWPDVPLDGELWIARGHFTEVSSVIRTGDPADPRWHDVHFMVFDLPADDRPFDARVMRMRKLLDDPAIPWLRPIRQFRLDSVAELDAKLKQIAAAGGEGLVLQRHDGLYRVGRSDTLLKYKPYDDAEARVIGYAPGHGKYKGMMGSLIVKRPDGLQFRIGTGFTDEQRADPPPIGSWVTYRYNGLTVNGVPRFARFLHIRYELPPPDPKPALSE
ncbi:MAG TPA: DNA ligase [Gammaproteobacteria bacterium]|nr:DNA ligase [Gammaproteobacteria bacterium]